MAVEVLVVAMAMWVIRIDGLQWHWPQNVPKRSPGNGRPRLALPSDYREGISVRRKETKDEKPRPSPNR